MCGIVVAYDFTGAPVNNGILQQFDKQRSRGTQGFGLFDGQELNIVRAAKENKILKWLCKYDSNLIMFHHRYPTSTINVAQAAHPFSTKAYFGDNQYIMVHNGVIYNSDELFVDHQELGMQYQSLLKDLTFNDSEALLWDLARTLEGEQPELTARGSIAFVCIKLHKGKLDKMYFGRNSNPLNMFRHKDGIALSSEGEGEAIDSQKLYTFNYKLKRLTKKDFLIPQFASNYSSNYSGDYNRPYSDGNYDHSYKGGFDGYRGRAGEWLPDNIKNNPKVRDYLTKQDPDFYGYDRDGNPLYEYEEYEHDARTQMLLPVGSRTQSQFLELEEDEELELYRPMAREVEAMALKYLLAAKGVFEVAYWRLEDDYSDALEQNDNSSEDIRAVLLFEETLELIQGDPEYIDANSVSSMWGALWEQATYRQTQ